MIHEQTELLQYSRSVVTNFRILDHNHDLIEEPIYVRLYRRKQAQAFFILPGFKVLLRNGREPFHSIHQGNLGTLFHYCSIVVYEPATNLLVLVDDIENAFVGRS